MKKSRIASPVPHAESPLRHLPLVDLLVDTKTELLELALRSGPEGVHRHARGGSHGHLRAAVCPRARSAGEPRGHDAERSGAGRPEGRHPASARPDRGGRGRAAHVSRRWPPPIRSIGASSSRCSWAWPRGSTLAAWSRLARRWRAGAPARARSAAASSPARRRSSRPGRVRRSTASTSSPC